jgi:AraC-like DNA-binding protein
MTLLALLGAVQGAVLGLALLTIRRGNRKANSALGVFVVMFSAVLSTQTFVDLDVFRRFPHLMFATHPLMFAFGPLLLLYARLLTSRTGKVNWRFWLNFLPFLVYVLLLIPFFALSADFKLALIDDNEPIAISDYLLTTSQLFQMLCYLALVYFEVRRHHQSLKDAFSSTEEICLEWLRSGIKWFFVLCFLMLLSTGLFMVGLETIADVTGNIVLISVVVIIYGIGYRGLRQPEILGLAAVMETGQKYEKSTLTDSAADRHLARLREVLDNEKPYLRGNLTIRDLADVSQIPSYHLSQLLNEKLNQKFYDFVNGYRVEEAKRALLDPANDHLTILTVALESGFSSKSAFNAAFKKFTDTTPSDFRKQHITA